MTFSGTITALITPYKNGRLDEEGLVQLLERQTEAKVDGVVLGGSTGEGSSLDEEEISRIISIAIRETKGSLDIIVGTGTYYTQETIERTKRAKDLGANGCLIVPPYYCKPTQEGIVRHFEAIAEASDFPIIVYNHPGRCGVNIEYKTMKRLAELPQIVAVKDCSANFVLLGDYLTIPDFTVLSGDDILTLPLMAMGGSGVISIVSNLVPEKVKNFIEAASQGHFEKAKQLHFELLPLFRVSCIESNPIPIKIAMELCGYPAGGLRLPLCELLPENRKILEEVLDGYGLTNFCGSKT
jgi:4-hydroxy-tetrahydrodipicolinate synthase